MRGQRLRGLRGLTNLAFERRLESSVSMVDSAGEIGCAATTGADSSLEDQLAAALGRVPTLEDNDGVVPLRSQLWGTVIWAGIGDHLDVLGHYHDKRTDVPAELRHRDWLTSGSDFSDVEFAALIDAIAAGMLDAAPDHS